jgi:hypothetical protein
MVLLTGPFFSQPTDSSLVLVSFIPGAIEHPLGQSKIKHKGAHRRIASPPAPFSLNPFGNGISGKRFIHQVHRPESTSARPMASPSSGGTALAI